MKNLQCFSSARLPGYIAVQLPDYAAKTGNLPYF